MLSQLLIKYQSHCPQCELTAARSPLLDLCVVFTTENEFSVDGGVIAVVRNF
ncbi:hypothetical protein JNB11_05745 [Kocuria palustris]|nr:hypothetical protein [Kocuria palustris]